MKLILFALIIILPICVSAQQMKDDSIPRSFVSTLNSKFDKIDEKITKRTSKMLKQFLKEDRRLTSLLTKKGKIDQNIENGFATTKIKELKDSFAVSKNENTNVNNYNSYLDTAEHSLQYIKEKIGTDGASKLPDKAKTAISKANVLNAKFKNAADIQKYMKERTEYLKTKLTSLGMVNKIKRLQKTAYYYKDYVKNYKELLKNKKKAEKKTMSLLYSNPQFKKFIAKNSYLATIFKNPGSGTDFNLAGVGMQTRATVEDLVQTNLSIGTGSPANIVKSQMNVATQQLNNLKSKINSYGGNTSEDLKFKPNTQKTKSFLQRIEYGFTIQFGKSYHYMPGASDIAVTIGYKLNDKNSFGIGASYKLGLGQGWNKIKLTSEGVGFRSYLDMCIKKSLFISGGYEQNYYSRFTSLRSLQTTAEWKPSLLIGISKKIKMKKGKSTKVQLLFDAFANRDKPARQQFIFRTGITLK